MHRNKREGTMWEDGFQIRRANSTDFGPIQWLLGTIWPQDNLQKQAAYAQMEAGGLHVATVAGEVVGFCSGFALPERWELDLLAVAPGHRGRGVGRALIRVNLGGVPTRAVIGVDNASSAAAFRAVGFHTDGIARTLLVFGPAAVAAPPAPGVVLHRVDTLTYRGIWVEPGDTGRVRAGMAYARGLAAAENRDVVGAFTTPAESAGLLEAFGALRLGEYHWWHYQPPHGGQRDRPSPHLTA